MAQTMKSYFRSEKRRLHIGESGKWIGVDDYENGYCSLCGWIDKAYYNFCPLCEGDNRAVDANERRN